MTRIDSAVFRSDRIESVWAHAPPWRMLRNLVEKRELLWQFTQRAVRGKYRGSYLGLFWAFLTPLLQLAVYSFVFSMIIRVEVPGVTGFLGYALFLFTGLIAFNVFAESATTSPGIITSNPNLVKKVVFPLELLPASLVGAAVFHSVLSMAMLLIVLAAVNGALPWTIVFLPLVYVPLVLLAAGMAWFLAALGVFLRDVSNLVAVAVNLLFFLTPILYSIEAMPAALAVYARVLMWVNPLASIVVEFQNIVIWAREPDWLRLAIVTLVCGAIALAGYIWFMKLKRAFADAV